MKLLVIATAALALLGTGSTYAQTIEISPNGSRRAAPAPAEYFTGSVIVEPLFGAKDSMPRHRRSCDLRGPAHAPHGIRTRPVKS
jgi:hypothetical protein